MDGVALLPEQSGVEKGVWHPSRWAYRGAVLICASILTLGSYCSYASVGALGESLDRDYGVTKLQLGYMYSVYSFPNIILVFVGGLFVDRVGIYRSTLLFTSLVTLGTVVVALTPKLYVMLAGRFILGLGAESLVVAQYAVFARWFSGKELAFACGVGLTLSRIGTLSAYFILPPAAEAGGVAVGLWVAVLPCILALAANFVLLWLDHKASKIINLDNYTGSVGDDYGGSTGCSLSDQLRVDDIREFPLSFWYVALLCVTFYNAVFPFTAFAPTFIHEKWGYSEVVASRYTSMVQIAAMIMAPIFGFAIDKVGKRASVMIAGSALIVPGHVLLGFTMLNPAVGMALIGIAFSLVPAALWPCISLLVKPDAVGTGFGLVTAIQNIGLFIVPTVIGALHDSTGEYTAGAAVFAALGLVGLVFSVLLKLNDAKANNYLLELPSAATGSKAILPTDDFDDVDLDGFNGFTIDDMSDSGDGFLTGGLSS